jgi:hypothetical protein
MAAKYVEILEEGLLGALQGYNIPIADFLFQHNNNPKHTAKLTQGWFEEKSIAVLPWPAQGLDMNIIENTWNYLDHWVHSRELAPRNVAKFWEALQEEWACINTVVITKLYDSMLD